MTKNKVTFVVPIGESGLKQHINLSEHAWLIIKEDMKDFYYDESKAKLSNFLNIIFINYYQQADASISIKFEQKYRELQDLFSSIYLNKDDFISILINKYEKELTNKSLSYPQGKAEKFRINKESLSILKRSNEGIYYKDATIGLYLKAIFEEYTTLPSYIREKIFFKEFHDKINLAIASKNKIKITLLPTISYKGTKNLSKTFIVSPYKILQDKTKSYNYLIGYSEERKPDGNYLEKRMSSFRISRIENMTILSSYNNFFSKDEISNIEKELLKKGVQYLAGEIPDEGIIIKFSKKGLESFKRQIYMRPQNYEKIDEFTYKFHCTEAQIINYFFKFGKDAQIIQPISLRNLFIKKYQDALDIYKQ